MYVASMRSNICSLVETLPDEAMSIDAAEQTLMNAELHIARLRSIQLDALEVLDRAQVATGDGAKSLAEWVAARADVGLDTARSLVRTMRRTAERPTLRQFGHAASVTFDRIEAAARVIPRHDPDPLFTHLDIAGLIRVAARRERIDTEREARTSDDQFLILQPSLDQSWFRIWGGLDGTTGALVDEALTAAADSLPTDDPGAPKDSGWRRAMALAVICVSDQPEPTKVSVFVDAADVTGSMGESGVYLEAGPGVGRRALESLLCDSNTELIVSTDDGIPMKYGRGSRTIPPSLRRAIIHRDNNRCALDGCDSRNRLQVHHIIPWSRGGSTDPDNLLTVCWYHHHVAIHHHDLEPYRHPEHGRWRLRPSVRPPPG